MEAASRLTLHYVDFEDAIACMERKNAAAANFPSLNFLFSTMNAYSAVDEEEDYKGEDGVSEVESDVDWDPLTEGKNISFEDDESIYTLCHSNGMDAFEEDDDDASIVSSISGYSECSTDSDVHIDVNNADFNFYLEDEDDSIYYSPEKEDELIALYANAALLSDEPGFVLHKSFFEVALCVQNRATRSFVSATANAFNLYRSYVERTIILALLGFSNRLTGLNPFITFVLYRPVFKR